MRITNFGSYDITDILERRGKRNPSLYTAQSQKRLKTSILLTKNAQNPAYIHRPKPLSKLYKQKNRCDSLSR